MRSTNVDPWEGFNRAAFSFNEQLDRAIVKPLAKAYRNIVPDLARQAVGNFFLNLDEIDNSINNLLQWKLAASSHSLARLMINSTIGLGGLVEVSGSMGLERHSADFAQTLALWGVGSGPYVVLPMLGPATLRNTVSRPAAFQFDALAHLEDISLKNSLRGLNLLHLRSELLEVEQLISGDRYTFIRDVYLQQRLFFITGKAAQDTFEEDDF